MALELVVALSTSIVVFTLCRRYGVWRWLSVLAAAPILLAVGRLGLSSHPLGQACFALMVSAVLLSVLWVHPSAQQHRGRLWQLIVGIGCAFVAIAPFAWWATGWGFASEPLAEQATNPVAQYTFVACLVLGLSAAVGLGRAETSGMRRACVLTVVGPITVLWATTTNGHPQWHDQLVVALLPAAGALALTALMRGRRGPGAHRSQSDEVDEQAVADFDERYSTPRLGPVVVVIAAFNEADGLPAVLGTMPATVCGLRTDVIVVDDGSTDGTGDVVAADAAALLVAPSANRGQGAALRLGYRIAREHGAEFIITTDADGQYDTADFATVLSPLVDGTADFVTGSRRRGRQETHDTFRRTGVHVFAWIVSAMTGHWTTDTSFGLRGMRAEVTEHVTLNQPQYQASELLLGVHSHGYRVAEVPGRMRVRLAGSTKKGSNAVYGRRYAGVVFSTWWREGCPTPARECAPALATAAVDSTKQNAGSRAMHRIPAWLRDNCPFVVALGLGIVVRLVVLLAYTPAFIHSDARTYLPLMDVLEPVGSRPVGYGIFILKPVSWLTHNVMLVASVQHLIGLATAVILYAVLRRWGARSWVATLGVLPLLFDAMQLVLEHTVLSDVLFVFFLVAGIALLVWRRDLDAKLIFASGLLLGAAVTVRLVGEPLILVAVAFCLLVGDRWRTRVIASLVVVVGFAIPVAAYATWYHHERGVFALSESTGKTLYLRTTSFVECSKLDIPDYQRVLCPTDPVGERRDPTWYVFSSKGNLRDLVLPEGVTEDEALREFANAAIRAQPLDYLRTVGRDFMLNFKIERVDYDNYETAWKWTFVTYDEEMVRNLDKPFYPDHGGMLEAHQPWSRFMVEYEKYAYLAGPLLFGCLVMGVAGALLPGRNGRRGLRPVIFVLVASGAGMLLVPDVTAEFVWRYQLPGVALLPAAAALAYTSLHRERTQPGTVATASTD